MQRLGTGATDADVVLFSKLWKAMFFNCTAIDHADWLAVFYAREDFDSSWSEVVEIMGAEEVQA